MFVVRWLVVAIITARKKKEVREVVKIESLYREEVGMDGRVK